jgi:hypothetical protein
MITEPGSIWAWLNAMVDKVMIILVEKYLNDRASTAIESYKTLLFVQSFSSLRAWPFLDHWHQSSSQVQ